MTHVDNVGPEPGRPSVGRKSRQPPAILGFSLAALAAALSWLVYSANRPDPPLRPRPVARLLTIDRPFPAEGRFPGDPYAGPKVCAECHPGEAALVSRSGHSSTLLPAGRRALSRSLDGKTITDPERPEVGWSYQFRDGRLSIARTAPDKAQEWVVDYAFGSGHHATTFVNVLDPKVPAILEHRLTYYTREAAMAITPGQDAESRSPECTPHGNPLEANKTRKCIRCHSTQMSGRRDAIFDEDTMIPNISCERCHGPSREHVAAARRGDAESRLSLPFGPERYTADDLLKMCGACHRHPSGTPTAQIRANNPYLARFQPVGLMQSKCYTRSAGGFSCVTCHDPHARASSDRASYDAKCLDCHRARRSWSGAGLRFVALSRRLPCIAAGAMRGMPHAEG